MAQPLQSSNSRTRLLLISLVLATTLLAGCSTFSGMFDSFSLGEEEDPKSLPPETLIVQGMDAYEVGDYSDAIKAFKTILDEHPFSAQAMLAELKAADAYYYNKQYPEAKALYKEFEERHPTNEAIPYILFQIGMCDFSRTDRIDRDTSGPKDAIKSFTRVVQTYPQSPYAKEAKARIKDAREFLANHEYMVAVFYVRTSHENEAIPRLKYLLAMYPESTLVPQAKALLQQLEAGTPPTWGMRKWLPEFMTTAPADRKEATPAAEKATPPDPENDPNPSDQPVMPGQ